MNSENEVNASIFHYWEAPGLERYAFGICDTKQEARRLAEKEIRDRKGQYGEIHSTRLDDDGVYDLLSDYEYGHPEPDGSVKWTERKTPD